MIIGVDTYAMIRKRYNDGESIRSISSALGVSRQTVKKYCEGFTHPDVRKPVLEGTRCGYRRGKAVHPQLF